jgi:hypothetical protein
LIFIRWASTGCLTRLALDRSRLGLMYFDEWPRTCDQT